MVERIGAPAAGRRSRVPPAAPRRTRERRDPGKTRAALLAAGAALFGEKGYDAVSIEHVAERAGVNKALISYHFGGKRGLYAEIIAHGFREIAARIEAAEAGAPDAAAALHGVLRAFHSFRDEHPEFPGLFVREVLSTGIEPRVVPHLAAIVGVMGRIAARGEREGSFRRVNPVLLHFGLIGPLAFFASTEPARRRAAARYDLPFAMPEMPEFLAYVEDLTLRGLSPDTRRAAPRSRRTLPRKPKGARA
jgi:AcrR family transcriptional regulator